jgi:hypothetical protein
MPRFTLRQMFAATALIALGIGFFIAVGRDVDPSGSGSILRMSDNPGLFGLMAIIGALSCGMIGAGIGVLFRRPLFGFAMGLGLLPVALIFLRMR